MNDHPNAPDADTGDLPAPLSRTALAARIGAGLVACVALSGFAFAVDHADRQVGRAFDLTGQVSATSPTQPAGVDCTGPGFGRVVSGAGVTVQTASGNVLATGRLDSGTATGDNCTFGFSMADVPRSHDGYRVTIDRLGGFTVSAKQAECGLVLLVMT
ncbi:hypothetical protein [Rhodococcus kronopolitis]|uniref:Uncharacterized protein n=1 Tax=Rhodococcus kronopolitis TaxID=1460226 RepID=A0ABV9FS82_9NOCA